MIHFAFNKWGLKDLKAASREPQASNRALPTVEELTLSREQMREIWSIVKSEPLASYQAFTLYYGFSVPTDEIAKELNLSEDAVRKRLSRTRNRIRRQLNIEQDSEGV